MILKVELSRFSFTYAKIQVVWLGGLPCNKLSMGMKKFLGKSALKKIRLLKDFYRPTV
jgi:hypothetical protein